MALLPSEIGRLILGFMKAEKCDKSHDIFLRWQNVKRNEIRALRLSYLCREWPPLSEVYATIRSHKRVQYTAMGGKTLPEFFEEYGE